MLPSKRINQNTFPSTSEGQDILFSATVVDFLFLGWRTQIAWSWLLPPPKCMLSIGDSFPKKIPGLAARTSIVKILPSQGGKRHLPLHAGPTNFALKLPTNKQINEHYSGAFTHEILVCFSHWHLIATVHIQNTPRDGFPDVENGAVLKRNTVVQKNQQLSCSCCFCHVDSGKVSKDWVTAFSLVCSQGKFSCKNPKGPVMCPALLVSAAERHSVGNPANHLSVSNLIRRLSSK